MSADKVKEISETQAKVDMSALWQQSMADDDFRFEIKAQSVAVDLVRAIAELGFTQTQFAEKLGWKTSRMSKVLHGASNITLRTIFEMATTLDLEFDVIYRRADQQRAAQPWEKQTSQEEIESARLEIQSMRQRTKENLTESEAMLATAAQLVRRSWKIAQVNVQTRPVKLAA